MQHFADINATFASSPGYELSYAMMTEFPKPDNTTSWFITLSDPGRPSKWSIGVTTGFDEGAARFLLLTNTWEQPTEPNCKRLFDTAVVSCRVAATFVPEYQYNYSLRIDHNMLEVHVSILETGENVQIGRVALEPDGVEFGPFPNFTQVGAVAVLDANIRHHEVCNLVSLPVEAFVFDPVGQSGVATTEAVDMKPCSDEVETVLQKESDGTKMQSEKRVSS